MEQPIQQPQIDLKNTSGLKTSDDKSVFQQGVILRKGYKILLDCNNNLIPFYEKNGFISNGYQMVIYL